MNQRKTQDYEIEWAQSGKRESVRAKSADAAAAIVARRHGADSARLTSGATWRYETVTCVPGGGMNLGATFWVRSAPHSTTPTAAMTPHEIGELK